MNKNYFEGILKERGISKSSVARSLGVTNQTVYNFIGGKKTLSLEEALKLKLFIRMTEREFECCFGDEGWYDLYLIVKGA